MNNIPHTIEIIIKPDGKVTGEVIGVTGPQCAELSKWLDELGKVEFDNPSPDFYKQTLTTTTIRR